MTHRHAAYRFWFITRHDLNERGTADFCGIGRTREEALDDMLARQVEEAQQDFGEHNLAGPDGYEPEYLEHAISEANRLNTLFYSDPDLNEYWDDNSYVWHIAWDYCPAWMQGVEQWVGPVNDLPGEWVNRATETPPAQ